MESEVNIDLNDELLVEFINEAREHLTNIESDLLAIEDGGASIDVELVNKVFRAAHSIKGASGYFGLNKVKELAHCAETVLDMIRSKKMSPNAEITNLLLAAFDRLREMINLPGESDRADIEELVDSLTVLASSYLPQERKESVRETIRLEPQGGGVPVELTRFDCDRAREVGNRLYLVEFDLIHDVERRGETVLEVFRRLYSAVEIVDCSLDFEALGTLDDAIGNRLPLRLVLATKPDKVDAAFSHGGERVKPLVDPSAHSERNAEPEGPPQETASAFNAMPERSRCADTQNTAMAQSFSDASGNAKASPATNVEESIRVNVATLETLMNLAGELVLGRNQLRASIAQNDDRALNAADQRINQITSELQDVVMQARLQPIGNVFGKFPRLVRDLSASLGKEVQLEIQGKDVALDRSIIESLSDPLTHMVRNAIDHGIESPDVRARAGKQRQGSLSISARHEAGHVVVEIVDDGGGIDPDQIARIALSKGLIGAEKLEGMTAKDKTSLIFLPGLSTNTEVSDISGRGVGMDVVKTNLDRLGGKVETISAPGRGTTFRIKLPLTLAIIPSLIVSVAGERFAIPQINVEEMRHVLPGDDKTRTEVVGDAEVLVLRDRLIPLVRLADFFGMADMGSERNEASRIVVVTTGAQSYGIVVSSFSNTEEIVVKPLGSHLKGLEEYAGATILGDGSLALILDVASVAARANVDAMAGSTLSRTADEETTSDTSKDNHSLVLFGNPPDVLCALPLDAVKRIECVDASRVEVIGGRRTMKYQGGLLPLVALADAAHVEPISQAGELAIIIVRVRGREVGLVGTMPVDVVETDGHIDQKTHRQRGVTGSTIIQNRTALIVDLHELVDASLPERSLERPIEKPQSEANTEDRTVLLAEDSDFFRSQIRRFLEEDGYAVLAASDGEAGWELLLKNIERVNAIVTDIEMPRLDGLGLTRRVRADRRTAHLPIIALTSLAADDDAARGMAAGVSDYQTKLDRDRLLERLREYTRPKISTVEDVTDSFVAA